MDELIEALQILRKYNQNRRPTHCGHDALYVPMDTSEVSAADKKRLEELGFEEGDFGFESYRFGSC